MARQARCSRIELPGMRPIIVAPSHAQCSGVHGVSCVGYLPRRNCCPSTTLSPCQRAPAGAGRTPKLFASGQACLAPRGRGRLGPRAHARSLGCGTLSPGLGASARRPARPERAPYAARLARLHPSAPKRQSFPSRGRPSVARAGASPRNATWLILPVVICLSQRLSHACVSMN